MAVADFEISPTNASGAPASPQSDGEAYVDNGATVTFELENTPPPSTDVQIAVESASSGAPALAFSSGVLSAPSYAVTAPASAQGSHSYMVRVSVSGGVDTSGQVNEGYTRRRILVVGQPFGSARKLVPGEVNQGEIGGWTQELDDWFTSGIGETYTRRTTDATTQTIQAIPITDRRGTVLRVLVFAHNDTDNKVYKFQRLLTVRCSSGVVTITATESPTVDQLDGGAATVGFTTGTNLINVRITGIAGKNIIWCVLVMPHVTPAY